MKRYVPSHEEILEMLEYDKETGDMTWKVRRGRMAWPGAKAGTMGPIGYKQVGLFGFRYMLHRVAWFMHYGEWPENELDHINGIRDDNRIENLRPATREQNTQFCKMRKDNTTGVKGVSFRDGRYLARVRLNGTRKHIGIFSNLNDAEAAIKAAREEMHKEFAKHY
jgi:hypothetical protein